MASSTSIVNHPIVKIAVLGSFIFLMTSFIAYRAGYFDAEQEDSSIAVEEDNLSEAEEVLEVEDTTDPKVLIPSSKFIVVPDESDTKKKSKQKKKKKTNKKGKKKRTYISGSKSAAVFESDFSVDTNKDLPAPIIPSSKSAAVFGPRDIIKPTDDDNVNDLKADLDSIKAAKDSVQRQKEVKQGKSNK